MKKLAITAVATFAAFVVNAASFSWGFVGSAEDPVSKEYTESGLTAMVFLGTVSFENGAWNIGNSTLLATAGYDADWGVWGASNTEALPSNDAVVAAGGQDYTIVLVNGDGVSDLASWTGDGKYYYLESGTSGTLTDPTATGSITYATMLSDTYASADLWSEAAGTGPTPIPEPTSGLLMLLGMAGLALRRRRA